VNQLGVEEGFGMAPDIVDQGLDQILGLTAACADEDAISGMDVAKDLLLRGKLLRIHLPEVFQERLVFHLWWPLNSKPWSDMFCSDIIFGIISMTPRTQGAGLYHLAVSSLPYK